MSLIVRIAIECGVWGKALSITLKLWFTYIDYIFEYNR